MSEWGDPTDRPGGDLLPGETYWGPFLALALWAAVGALAFILATGARP